MNTNSAAARSMTSRLPLSHDDWTQYSAMKHDRPPLQTPASVAHPSDRRSTISVSICFQCSEPRLTFTVGRMACCIPQEYDQTPQKTTKLAESKRKMPENCLWYLGRDTGLEWISGKRTWGSDMIMCYKRGPFHPRALQLDHSIKQESTFLNQRRLRQQARYRSPRTSARTRTDNIETHNRLQKRSTRKST